MRVQNPTSGQNVSHRLAAALPIVLLAALMPLQAAPAQASEVVSDRVNGFTLQLPAGWGASVPAEGALNGATVLLKRTPGAAPPQLIEGEVLGSSLKIQLTTGDRVRYLEDRLGGCWPAEAASGWDPGRDRSPGGGPLATRVAGLEAAVSAPPPAPGGPGVLEVAIAIDDHRVLIAAVMPIGSPSLVEALAILETIRVDGLSGVAPDAPGGSAVERAARLVDLVMPKAPAPVAGTLAVTSPVGGSVLVQRGRYPIEWTPPPEPPPPGDVEIAVLNAADEVVANVPGPVADDGSVSWVVPDDLEGAHSVRVTRGAVSAESASFEIAATCGGGGSYDGAEAAETPIPLHMPFQIGSEWIVGGASSSFYGRGAHCNGHNDYYATDWSRADAEDEPVLAVADGVVIEAPPCTPDNLGCWVTVDHGVVGGDTVITQYGHLGARYVEENEVVRVGSRLGDVGLTGTTFGPHLHFRMRVGGDSRCDIEEPLCPNDELPMAHQSPKSSPMTTWVGGELVSAALVDGATYRSANGIRVVDPAGGEAFSIGQTVDIRWDSELVSFVNVDLRSGTQRWVIIEFTANDGLVEWTIPETLPTGIYRIVVSDWTGGKVYDESEEFTIDATSCDVSLQPPSLAAGTIGEPYHQQLILEGGSAPVRVRLLDGELPEGLELTEQGNLNGVPEQVETERFLVEAEDAEGCWSIRQYDLEIISDVQEACNGLDDDRDGEIDEDGACKCRKVEEGGSTYHFCDEMVDWYDARRACTTLGSALVKVESSGENAWIAAEAAPFNRWIGLTDAPFEGQWHWTDSSPLGFFAPWGPFEPNGGSEENCGQLYSGIAEWNDLRCHWLNRFVCQEAVVPGDDLCVTGNLIYDDIYDIYTGPVDHPVDLAIDDGDEWIPIGQLTPAADGRFCLPVLWTRRYRVSEAVALPPWRSTECVGFIDPTDPGSSGSCGDDESDCETLGDLDFFCGS